MGTTCTLQMQASKSWELSPCSLTLTPTYSPSLTNTTQAGSDFHFSLCHWMTLASLFPSGPQFPRLNDGCAEPCLPPTLTRSLDRLDSVDMLLPSKCPSWEEDYNPVSDSLNDSSCISQVRVVGSQMVSGCESSHPRGQTSRLSPC